MRFYFRDVIVRGCCHLGAGEYFFYSNQYKFSIRLMVMRMQSIERRKIDKKKIRNILYVCFYWALIIAKI